MKQEVPKIPNLKVLCLTLGISENDLVSVLQNIDSYYYRLEKIKKDHKGVPVLDKEGKPKIRVLYPSEGLLKIIQQKISKRILLKVVLPINIKGGVKGADNIKNASYHIGNKYKFATDLKDFFPSISEKTVFHTFRRLGYVPKISEFLAKLITYQGYVPQGAPTSTAIANLVFLPIDQKIIAFCDERKIKYSRFVDDLSFSAAFDFRAESISLIKMVTPSFKISRKKTFFTSGKAKFTGLWVGVSSLDVDEAFKQRMNDDPKKKDGETTPRTRYYRRVRNSKQAKNAKNNTTAPKTIHQ